MEEIGKIFIVATPIGNLKDITYRAVEVLKSVDVILCEDTRVSSRLLTHYEIEGKTLISYHQRSRFSKMDKISELLKEGKDLALITDAGTPGISDPGNELLGFLLQEFGDELQIIPTPGVSAFTTLASVAGVNMKEFVFLGFPPNKKGRQKFFKRVLGFDIPVIYYESPYRLMKNFELLSELNAEKGLNFVIGRELTKMFEQIVRGDLNSVKKYFQENPNKVKGEFVIIVY